MQYLLIIQYSEATNSRDDIMTETTPTLDEQIAVQSQRVAEAERQANVLNRSETPKQALAYERAILASLEAMKAAREILDKGFMNGAPDIYDIQAVNVAHRVLPDGPMPRETVNDGADAPNPDCPRCHGDGFYGYNGHGWECELCNSD